MNTSEFVPQVFPGVNAHPYIKQASVVVKDHKDPMTFRVFEGKVETLNGAAQKALADVKSQPEEHPAFVLALINAADRAGRKTVLRIREDGARIQISKI